MNMDCHRLWRQRRESSLRKIGRYGSEEKGRYTTPLASAGEQACWVWEVTIREYVDRPASKGDPACRPLVRQLYLRHYLF